jgi:TPR repeat protein
MRAIAAICLVVFAAVPSPPFSSWANPPRLTQSVPATDCDTYAANPLDPERVTEGVTFEKVNPDLAVPACESAVRQYPDSSRLTYQLGRAYSKRNDFSSAVVQYRKAADQGYVSAQNNLGAMYATGRGVPQNYTEALNWYRKAADQGNAMAQFNLGTMYQEGRGVPQDYAEAVKWCRKAADQGDTSAQNNLGIMYQEGRGVRQNYAEAVKWYRKAADQCNAMAEVNLGTMYATGRGVAQKSYRRILVTEGIRRQRFELAI